MQCTICLSDEGEVLQRGCHCRGDSGAVHLDCLIEVASHAHRAAAAAGRGGATEGRAWMDCATCKARFTGPACHGLAEHWFGLVESRDAEDDERVRALLNLACEVNARGDYAASEGMIREVLDIRTRVLGPDDADTLWTAHTLAAAQRNHGKYQEALELLVATAESMARVMGEDDVATRSVQGELAVTYRSIGQYDKAVELQKATFESVKRSCGADDPITLGEMHELIATYTDMGATEEAIALAQDLLERRKRVQGRTHPHTLASINGLAILLMKEGKYAEAEALEREVHAGYCKLKGTAHPHTVIATANLGFYVVLAGNPDEGNTLLEGAIGLARSLEGFDQQLTMYFCASRGLALTGLQRHDEAIELLRATHAQQADAAAHGPDHPYTLRTACFLGGALVAQGAVDEGRALLETTLVAQTRVLGERVYDTRQTALRLAECPPTTS